MGRVQFSTGSSRKATWGFDGEAETLCVTEQVKEELEEGEPGQRQQLTQEPREGKVLTRHF